MSPNVFRLNFIHFNRCTQIFFIFLFYLLSSNAYSWLGERLSKDIADQAVVNNDEVNAAPITPWIASEELEQQRKAYRQKILSRWPNARDSLRKTGFTYYTDDLQSSVSVLFARNEIEIIVPKGQGKNSGPTSLLARQQVAEHLRSLLGMNKTAMIEFLADELMLEPEELASNSNSESLVFAELFSSKAPSQEEINRLAHKILQTARIHVKAQNNGESFFVSPDKMRFVMNMPDARIEAAAKQYYHLVKKFSEDYKVPASLVLAIMHTESFFNPFATSPIPAFGLMQIVPHTGGADAAQLIFRENSPTLSPAFLYDEENNLQLGVAYLHILYYRYLSDITSERSRAYTAIAAYNTGPSNIARAFVSVSHMSEAIPIINAMSDREVLERMRNYAPSAETREYIAKVIAREKFYQRAITYW